MCFYSVWLFSVFLNEVNFPFDFLLMSRFVFRSVYASAVFKKLAESFLPVFWSSILPLCLTLASSMESDHQLLFSPIRSKLVTYSFSLAKYAFAPVLKFHHASSPPVKFFFMWFVIKYNCIYLASFRLPTQLVVSQGGSIVSSYRIYEKKVHFYLTKHSSFLLLFLEKCCSL